MNFRSVCQTAAWPQRERDYFETSPRLFTWVLPLTRHVAFHPLREESCAFYSSTAGDEWLFPSFPLIVLSSLLFFVSHFFLPLFLFSLLFLFPLSFSAFSLLCFILLCQLSSLLVSFSFSSSSLRLFPSLFSVFTHFLFSFSFLSSYFSSLHLFPSFFFFSSLSSLASCLFASFFPFFTFFYLYFSFETTSGDSKIFYS